MFPFKKRKRTSDSKSHTPATDIAGNVQKLLNIGRVEGNVFVTSDRSVKGILGQIQNIDNKSDLSVADETEYIDLVIHSEQFGRQIRIRVPMNIATSTLVEILVQLFNLPRYRKIDEVGLYLKFDYGIGKRTNNSSGGTFYSGSETLPAIGLTDGDAVNLGINVNFWDETLQSIVAHPLKMYALMPPAATRKVAKAMRDLLRGDNGIERYQRIVASSFPNELVG